MQVLTDLVDHAYVFTNRLGFIARQHQRLVHLSRPELVVISTTRRRETGNAERGEAGQFRVMGSLTPVNRDATFFQQATEKLRCKFRGIFDGQRLIGALIVQRHIAPQRQDGRSGLAIDKDFAAGPSRRGNDPVINAVVIGERRHTDEGPLARAIRRQDIHEYDIVIDRKGRNWCSVAPHQVILAPAFAVAFKCKVRVIGNDVTVNVLHAFLY